MLETAISSACRTPILGWLPRDPQMAIAERHLGLHTVEESGDVEDADGKITELAEIAEKHLDLARILALQCGLDMTVGPLRDTGVERSPVRIGVARDRAFSFYYEDNFDLLRQNGAELVPFSPLLDPSLPDGLDALYLGGGYPELYAQKLSANGTMRDSIRQFAASGRPVYAECGGMIYLSQQLATTDGIVHPMAGVLPFKMEMTAKLVCFGYVSVELLRDCMLGSRGTLLRGHSFHYSRIIDEPRLPTSYLVHYSLSGQEEFEGFVSGNVLASYLHIHFRTAPEIATRFVEMVRRSKADVMVTA